MLVIVMARSKSFLKKYTATITCEHGLWITFKTWAKKQNSSASAEIEKFMLQAVTSKSNVADLYEQKENLESLLRMIVDEELDSRGYYPNNTENTDSTDNIVDDSNTDNPDDTDKTIKTDNTEGTDKIDNDSQIYSSNLLSTSNLTNSTDNIGNTDIIKSTDGTDNTDNTKNTNNTDGIGNTDNADKIQNTDGTDDTEKNQRSQSGAGEQIYTDKQLKEKEGLTQNPSTIYRWRKGQGRIPERIAQNYEIIGTKWKRK